jgi:hypothetical protein
MIASNFYCNFILRTHDLHTQCFHRMANSNIRIIYGMWCYLFIRRIHTHEKQSILTSLFNQLSTRRESARSMLTFQITTYFVHVLKLLRVTNTQSLNKSNKSNLTWTSKVHSQNISPIALLLV